MYTITKPCVYALATKSSVDGYDNIDIRYVGMSKKPAQRLYIHLLSRFETGATRACAVWIRETIAAGDEVVMLELEQVYGSYERLRQRERDYIADLRQCYNLLNVQVTGRGQPWYTTDVGCQHLLDYRKKLIQDRIEADKARGKPLAFNTPAAKAARAATTRSRLKGKPLSLDHRQKIAAGLRKIQKNLPSVKCPICDYAGLPCHVTCHRKRVGH